MKQISMIFSYLILLYAIVMAAWGILGFLGYFFGITPLGTLNNPTFPAGTQLIHYLLIFSSGAIYLTGYFSKWKHTPFAMVVIFAMLATLCSVETFDFMENPGRYFSFVVECLMYIGISIYLFRSQRMRTHFGR